MTNEELARKAVANVAKVMLIKWGVIIGINMWARRYRRRHPS